MFSMPNPLRKRGLTALIALAMMTASGGIGPIGNACAQLAQTAQPTGSSKKILKLDYDFEAPPSLELVMVDSEKGTMQLRALEGHQFPANFTEGHYFLLPTFPKDNPTAESPALYRVQVIDIAEAGTITVQIDPQTANAIQPGDRFYALARPEGATTKQIMAFPPSVKEDQAAQEYKKKATEISKFLEEASGSLSHLRRIGDALLRYEKEQGYFPPAVTRGPDGKPWHSWRVLILPYLGQKELFEAYDLSKPWNDPQNLAMLDQMPEVYRDPSYPAGPVMYAHYVAVTGEGTAFRPEGIRLPNPEILKTKKPYYELPLELRKSLVTLTRIQDDPSRTIAVVPVAPGSKLIWTKPEDMPATAAEAKLGQPGAIAAPYRFEAANAAPVLMFDGAAKLLRDSVEADALAAMLTIAGNETLDEAKTPFLDMPSIFTGQRTLTLKFTASGPCYVIEEKRPAASGPNSRPKADSSVITTTYPVRRP